MVACCARYRGIEGTPKALLSTFFISWARSLVRHQSSLSLFLSSSLPCFFFVEFSPARVRYAPPQNDATAFITDLHNAISGCLRSGYCRCCYYCLSPALILPALRAAPTPFFVIGFWFTLIMRVLLKNCTYQSFSLLIGAWNVPKQLLSTTVTAKRMKLLMFDKFCEVTAK